MTDQMEEKLRLSVFGFKFKVTIFISFLCWTGMVFCALMIIGSLALLTIQTDAKPWFLELIYELLTEGCAFGYTAYADRRCYHVVAYICIWWNHLSTFIDVLSSVFSAEEEKPGEEQSWSDEYAENILLCQSRNNIYFNSRILH